MEELVLRLGQLTVLQMLKTFPGCRTFSDKTGKVPKQTRKVGHPNSNPHLLIV